MSDVTDADRDKAEGVAEAAEYRGRMVLVTAIAAALAEEREKARAPFLAVAEQYESHVRACEAEGLDSGDLAAAAVDLRRAAAVTE